MPLLPPVKRYSASSSKSAGVPSRQIRNVFCFGIAPGLVSPTIAPFSTRQNAGSPSQPFSVLPSNIACAGAHCAATNNSRAALMQTAGLRLRDAQAKRIQSPVLGANVDAAAADRERAEMRES